MVMKTEIVIAYNSKEYNKEEMTNFKHKIETKLPVMLQLPGIKIMHGQVSFMIRDIVVDLENELKVVQVQQLTSRQMLKPN